MVSFPKAGRTWIRLFLEYYKRFAGRRQGGVFFRHDDRIYFERQVLLIRHPCDVMVSFHIHRVERRKAGGAIGRFIRTNSHGIPFFNRCYTQWSQREDNQLVIRYEDLFDSQAWLAMLEFFGFPFDEAAFDNAREKTRFDNIRNNLEEIKGFPGAWRYLAAEHGKYNVVEPKNPEAHKFRRGKVGGYVDYLSEDDISYILDTFTLGKNLESMRQQYLLESEGHARS